MHTAQPFKIQLQYSILYSLFNTCTTPCTMKCAATTASWSRLWSLRAWNILTYGWRFDRVTFYTHEQTVSTKFYDSKRWEAAKIVSWYMRICSQSMVRTLDSR